MTEINDVTSLTKSVNRIAKALDQDFSKKSLTDSLDAIADYIEENGAGGGGNSDILTVYVSQDISIIEQSEDYPDGGVNKVTYISIDPPTIDEIGEFDSANAIYPVTWNRSNVLQSDDIMIQSYFTGKTLKIIECYVLSQYDSEQSDYVPTEMKRPHYITGVYEDDNLAYGTHYYTYVISDYNPRDHEGNSYVNCLRARYDVNGETKTWSFGLLEY